MAQRFSLKRYLPRGLYGRAALILLLPVISLQFIVGLVFIQRHFEGVTEQMTGSLVLELGLLQAAVEGASDLPTAQQRLTEMAPTLDIEAVLPGAAHAPSRVFYDLSGKVVIDTLQEGHPNLTPVDLSNWRRVRTGLPTRYGLLEVDIPRKRVSASNPHQLLVIMGVMGGLLTLISYIFLRNQLRPMARLAQAAEDYGRGRIVPYRIAGATQVRAAGQAFLAMRNRIERQTQARRLMLSGLSHDLRTPLTRMRLELSLMDEEDAAPLLRDVDDMTRLVGAFLDYAQGDATETPEPVDLTALLHAAADAAERLGPVEVDAPDGPDPVLLRPLAIRRAVDNLIGNGLRHGTRVRLRLRSYDGTATIDVEDDGSGIPADRRDEALRPFARLDPARNQDQGSGVGLGLAIVGDIARTHGGRLVLGDSNDLGGLRARLELPL